MDTVCRWAWQYLLLDCSQIKMNAMCVIRYLLSPVCRCCPEPKVFSKFEELEQHMRKQHEVFSCKLCTNHLKVHFMLFFRLFQGFWGQYLSIHFFPYISYFSLFDQVFCHERKWYNRKGLAQHRAHGDPDDTSHRGHPLCKFCDDRYLDNDELLKHLRRDHYFCHFCDADGSQEYYRQAKRTYIDCEVDLTFLFIIMYLFITSFCWTHKIDIILKLILNSDYQYLTEHFRERHYLCEDGHCATEQFTHAFRTEIDYKAHKAALHSKNRAEARQNRHIDLQFNYAPRQQRRNEGQWQPSVRSTFTELTVEDECYISLALCFVKLWVVWFDLVVTIPELPCYDDYRSFYLSRLFPLGKEITVVEAHLHFFEFSFSTIKINPESWQWLWIEVSNRPILKLKIKPATCSWG